MPIVCVDLVVTDSARKRFLLVKRANEPKAGKWWVPGGRLLKNERLTAAALRKLKEETGLRGTVIKCLGFHEYFSRTGYFKGTNAHSITFIFLVEVPTKKAPIAAHKAVK